MRDSVFLTILVGGMFSIALVVSQGALWIGFEPMPGPAAGMPTVLGMVGSSSFAILFFRFVLFKQLKSGENDS